MAIGGSSVGNFRPKAELTAVFALDKLPTNHYVILRHYNDKPYRVLVICDNEVVVNTVKGFYSSKTHHYYEFRKIRKLIHKLKYIPEFYHIPSHKGHAGNELADLHAKQAKKSLN